MSLRRIMNYSSLIYNKFNKSLPFFSVLSGKNVGLGQTSFFSTFCNSTRCIEPQKVNFESFDPILIHSRGMKVKGNLELRCKGCYFARQDGEMIVLCTSYPRHRQKLRVKKPKYKWILTHAMQSKVRPY